MDRPHDSARASVRALPSPFFSFLFLTLLPSVCTRSPATPRPVTVGFLEPRLAALEAATSLFACLLTSLSVGLASGHARSVFQAARAAAAPRSSAYFDAFGWASRLVSRVGLVTAQRPPAPPPPPGVAALARQHPAQFVFAACYVVAACAAFSWTCCEHLPKAWAGAGRLLSDVYRFTTCACRPIQRSLRPPGLIS